MTRKISQASNKKKEEKIICAVQPLIPFDQYVYNTMSIGLSIGHWVCEV